MSNIPKSQLDAVDTRVEVMLRKLFEGRTVNFEDLNGVDILSPDDDDTLFYNFTLDLWENHPLKTINGQSLKGPGNIVISGGSGSPGGSSGQFQWNDSGAFGGTTGYTWNFGTSQPLSTNGYLLGATSSLEEIDGGALVTTSTTLEPISGLIASVDLISNKSTTATARLNTNSGATNKYLQVEINRSSPRYFDGTALRDVWHTGTFDPSTKQDTLVSGTNIKSINGDSLLGSGDLTISGISSISRAITVGFDAGKVNGLDQPLVTGLKFELRAPFGLDPTEWTLLPKGASSGAITIEVRKRPFSSGSFSSITGGSPPSITGGARGTGSATGWTTIDSGDLIEFEITSVTGDVFGITLIVEATEV